MRQYVVRCRAAVS